MLIFHCTDCEGNIIAREGEDPEQIFDKLDEHITKCRFATFTIEPTTEWAKDIAEIIRSAIRHEDLKGKLRLD